MPTGGVMSHRAIPKRQMPCGAVTEGMNHLLPLLSSDKVDGPSSARFDGFFGSIRNSAQQPAAAKYKPASSNRLSFQPYESTSCATTSGDKNAPMLPDMFMVL